MKKVCFITLVVLAVACLSSCRSNKPVEATPPAPAEGICAVLGFQYGTNVTAEEAKEITDLFRINFSPSKYRLTDDNRVDNELAKRGYKNRKMTKQQMCEVGRDLGARLVVVGTINKLMDEYSVDVQVVDTQKGTTVAFEGDAFQKPESSKRIQDLAKKLASKTK